MSDAIQRLNAALEGRYRIERAVGEGGMATVYLADDLRHARRVALKVLKREFVAAVRAERFLAEIRTMARLRHPHVLPLFDSGEVESLLFYVMPFVEGDSLRDRLRSEGRLPVREALKITTQIAGALDHAHSCGVLHRDVKPENVLLWGGEAVLADFGVAVALDDPGPDPATAGEYTAGTVSYMSPEQVEGERRLDGRSDLYSLACILYELLTGKTPHQASSPHAIVARRLNAPPAPVRSEREDVPQHVDDALRRALATAPNDRFDSVGQFVEHLQSGWDGFPWRKPEPAGRVGGAKPGLVVLPIENLSGAAAHDYFCDGLAVEMTHVLGHVPGLRVVPRASAFAVARRGERIRSVVRELGVTHALAGTARFAGDSYVVNLTLIEGEDESPEWDDRFEGTLASDDVFDLQDQIARGVLATLSDRLLLPRLEERPSAEAYTLYLRARHAWFTREIPNLYRAIGLFEQAIERDAGYARAHAGIADVYNVLGGVDYATEPPADIYEASRLAATRALELYPELPEAHAALGNYLMSFEWDWSEAGRHLRKALELNPGYSSGRQWYSNYLMYTGREEDALVEARRALEHDPRSVFLSSSLARHLMFARRPHEAIEQFRGALDIDENFSGARIGMALAELQAGRKEIYLEQIEAMSTGLDSAPPLLRALNAHAAGLVGDEAKARALLDRLIGDSEAFERANRGAAVPAPSDAGDGTPHPRYVPPEFVGLAHLGLGENEMAIDWLEKARAARSQALSQLRVEPLLDPIRDHPRFARILAHVSGARAQER